MGSVCFGNLKPKPSTVLLSLTGTGERTRHQPGCYPLGSSPSPRWEDMQRGGLGEEIPNCSPPPKKMHGGPRMRDPVPSVAPSVARSPDLAPSPAPPGPCRAPSFELTSEGRPEGGRRRASSLLAAMRSGWFLLCYLPCSLGEKTSPPAGVLPFPLFIQDYASNPIIKHRSCPESRLIACRCAPAPAAARPPRPPAPAPPHAGPRIRTRLPRGRCPWNIASRDGSHGDRAATPHPAVCAPDFREHLAGR